MSFFSFPKDSVRRKTWTIYCRRDKFVPENHSRLCSKHFSKDQVERDPNVLERLGYANARIRLKKDAVPDVPLRLQEAASLALPPKTRGAFAKRNKPYVSLSFIYYDLKKYYNFLLLERFSKPTCTRTCTCRKENMCITSSVCVMTNLYTYVPE